MSYSFVNEYSTLELAKDFTVLEEKKNIYQCVTLFIGEKRSSLKIDCCADSFHLKKLSELSGDKIVACHFYIKIL